MPYIGGKPNLPGLGLNGVKLILDADSDTSITADTDDQIDIEIAGSDEIKITAAMIAPATADGSALGGASNEWSDLYLADSGVIYFGADQDVTVTHDPDDGLFLKSIATSDNNPILLTLQTGETDMAADDVIGKISFQAPDEGTGTDAILVAAAIQARSEGNFAADANATSLDFMTGLSGAAAKRWSITSAGTFLNAGTNIIDMNAGELILDADADTSITASTDDQIDFKISGADDFRMTANTFTALSGSTVAIASGATIANSGTATGFGAGATTAKTAAYTIVSGDDSKTILCSAASADYTITLIAASSAGDGFEITLKKTDATKFMITVDGNGSETIDGWLRMKLREQYASITIVCDGSNWHIKDHSNMVYEYNNIHNPCAQINQYSHVTATGLGASTAHFADRWQLVTAGSATARWTFSVGTTGGIGGKSDFFQLENTTADGSPGSGEKQWIRQTIIGDDSVGAGYLGTDGLFENGVLSMDMNFEKGGGSSLSAPYIVSLVFVTLDGTQREIFGNVSITADNVWQRVYFPIIHDSVARIDPSQGNSHHIAIGLYAHSDNQSAAGPSVWANLSGDRQDDAAGNLADATGNKIKWTNVKFQPGQIATPFTPRTHSLELKNCQFFYYRLDSAGGASHITAFGTAYSTTAVQWAHDIPDMRRVDSTLTVSSAAHFKAYTANFSSGDAFSNISDPGSDGYQMQ